MVSSNCDDLLAFCKLDHVCPASVDNDLCLCNHDKSPTCQLSSGLFYVMNNYDSCSTCTETSCQRKLYGCFDDEGYNVLQNFKYETCNSDKLYCKTTCHEDQIYTEWVDDEAEKVENCNQKCGEQYYTRRRELRSNAENLLCSIPATIKLEEQIPCNTRCCGHKSEVTSISAPFQRGEFCYKTESITETCDDKPPTFSKTDIKVPCSDPGLQVCSDEHVKSCIDSATHQVKHIDGCQGILFEKKLACELSCTYGRQTYFYTCSGEEIVAARYTTDDVGVCNSDSVGCPNVGLIGDDDEACEDFGSVSCVPIPDALCTSTAYNEEDGEFQGMSVDEHCTITVSKIIRLDNQTFYSAWRPWSSLQDLRKSQ